uniref:Uncharacterized protein n=1 Tax=Oryza sativa subsp. japonica TaxID=39947 RepID=Q6K364_ORYSJ|nr:hypothetical protein [Oryza sativa Japonica Group]
MADLEQSSSDAAALKKLYTGGAVPPRQTMAREKPFEYLKFDEDFMETKYPWS